ncbi:MAG: GTPase [Polyangiales bacterium]
MTLPPTAEPGKDDRDTAQALDDVEELLKRIPGARRLVTEVQDLRALLVDRRPPRIAVVGRRGVGKSSLANALLGVEVAPVGAVEDTTAAPGWYDVTTDGKAIRWLDTPGLRAGAEPSRREVVERALRAERPDVVLLLVKASQVDAGIDEDLDEARALLTAVAVDRKAPPPVIAVLTKVDELAGARVKAPPFDADTARRENIAAAVTLLRSHLDRVKLEVKDVVPVATWQRFKDGVRVTDWRWNLETLGAVIFEALPNNAQVEAARALERGRVIRRRVAMRIVGTATSVSVVIGATPLPVADLALLLPLQSAMLTSLVYVSGRGLGPRAVSEWLGAMGLNVSSALGLREAARAALKLIPGIGATISGAVAGTGTWALGVAAVRYFFDGGTAESSRAAFDDAVRDGPPPDEGPGGADEKSG